MVKPIRQGYRLLASVAVLQQEKTDTGRPLALALLHTHAVLAHHVPSQEPCRSSLRAMLPLP